VVNDRLEEIQGTRDVRVDGSVGAVPVFPTVGLRAGVEYNCIVDTSQGGEGDSYGVLVAEIASEDRDIVGAVPDVVQFPT
jgi:hypothetical protein